MAGASTAKPRWALPKFENISFTLMFLGLPLAIYVIFVILPFVQAFYYSLTDWTGFSKSMNFVGLSNYLALTQDPVFIKAVTNSIVLVLILPPLVIILSVTLATLVTIGGATQGEIQGLKHSGIYRVISFFPYTVPAIVIGILWAQMYDPSSGLLNGIMPAQHTTETPAVPDAISGIIQSVTNPNKEEAGKQLTGSIFNMIKAIDQNAKQKAAADPDAAEKAKQKAEKRKKRRGI